MKVDITGRGIDITTSIRSFTETKLERLKKIAEDMHDIHVVLSTEKYRQKAEIKFLINKRSFYGTEETNDMFQAVDHVVHKLESQLKKHKNKITAKKRSTTESIRLNSTLDETPNPLTRESMPEGEVQVIRTKSSEVRPMNLEEAIEELQKFPREFLFYRNPENNQVNVVYNRRDGHIGLIEPGN